MAQVRAETTPVHVLVNVCGMEEEALYRCLSVLSEVFMAISFLRHSAVVASVNAIGAGAPVRRPVCSMSSLQSQIDAIKSAFPRSPLSHQEGRCSCAQDFGRVAELLLQADGTVLILTSPTHLPETRRLVSFWKASSGHMEMILLRRDDEDIGATVAAIMELVESIGAFPHVSVVQADDSLLDLRRTMKPWLRRLQSYVPCTIAFKEKPMRLHLVLRSAMCVYRDESRAFMHAGLGAMTGLHYVPLSSIDGSVVLGYPLHADVEPAPSENADLCLGLQHLLQTKNMALVLRCTNNEQQSEYFAMVSSSSAADSNTSGFVFYRVASIDQLTFANVPEGSDPSPTRVERIGSIAATMADVVPTQPFNPYNYASGASVHPLGRLPPPPTPRLGRRLL